ADLRDEGRSIDERRQCVLENRRKLNLWFFSSNLTFFIKGGRVSKSAGFIGGLLNICPLLNVDVDGKLIPRKNIRTKKKAIVEIVNRMEENADGGLDYSGKCYICNSACEDDALAVAKRVEEKFPKLNGKVEIYSIGTTIGAHTGPGTVALFFWGKERVD
ncbi:MAG: DegV family EDD domain-containing protein, partial [Clostridiales bacterium]|nr:DegV family EDD domain-containing protein [Clostridiales bacterium]